MLFLRHCDIMTVFIYKQLSKTLQGIRIEVYSIAIAISAFRNIDPSTGKQRHRKCRNLQLTAQREQWGDQRRAVCLNKRYIPPWGILRGSEILNNLVYI